MNGALGRVGRFAADWLEELDEVERVVRADRGDELSPLLGEVEVAFDFTVAGLGFLHGRAFVEAGVRPVIGTSGVTRDEVRELDALARARGLGGLVVPNFSLGIACLRRAVEEAARTFSSAEILELHHDRKVDAPSATAGHLRELLTEHGIEAPIHSVRLPGLYAHHEVLFGGPGETLRVRHDMAGPEAFGPGITAALRHVLATTGVAYGLEAVLPGGG